MGRDRCARPRGAPKPNRTVGIFYFLWHQSFAKYGPFDVSKILAAHPDALLKPEGAGWGPPGVPHYWGEPLFGYYRNDDAWVLRKHAQMLANAGVDTLIFDTTNAQIYRDEFLKLCEVFAQARRDGVRAPQIASARRKFPSWSTRRPVPPHGKFSKRSISPASTATSGSSGRASHC
ncbi:MAG: hypothetical protein NTY53_10605 [Kiritimatiellaeota bacterium]|nr:hypothetical protein [Kiritimatiellota bacterium]